MTETNLPAAPKPPLGWKWPLLALSLLALLTLAAGVFFSFARAELPRNQFPLAEIPGPAPLTAVVCTNDSFSAVRKYPAFVSAKPLYSCTTIDCGASPADESANTWHFAFDESRGAGAGYDRLYFDLNHNLDLSDDPPVGIDAKSVAAEGTVFFEYLTLPCDYGPGIGVRDFRFQPRLRFNRSQERGPIPQYAYYAASFACATARRGKVLIAGRTYELTLSHQNRIAGRFDGDSTDVSLAIRAPGAKRPAEIWWAPPKRIIPLGGGFYRLRPSPTGDTVKVEEYAGDLGVLRFAPHRADLGPVVAAGSIASADSEICIGQIPEGEFDPWEKVEKTSLPVGDYCPQLLNLAVGRVLLGLSRNSNSDGVPRDWENHPPRYFIEIRRDKPFVYSLPAALEVVFVAPRRAERFKPGDTVTVNAALIDPVTDVVIQSLRCVDSKAADSTKRPNDGRAGDLPSTALSPRVVISDSSGGVVAEGTMAFG